MQRRLPRHPVNQAAPSRRTPSMTTGNKKESNLLFPFLRLVAIATARKKLTPRNAGVAIWVALGSSGTTGENAVVDTVELSRELGMSPRTAQRAWAELLAEGWFEQTSEARRGSPGKPGSGRRARYRLCLPSIDLGLLDGAPDSRAVLASHTYPHGAPPDPGDVACHEVAEDLWHDKPATYDTTGTDLWHDTHAVSEGARLPSVGLPTNSYPAAHQSASTTDRARPTSERSYLA